MQAWPYILTFTSLQFHKSTASVTGGRTLTGSEFVVRSDAGFWLASGTVAVRGQDRMLAYQGLMAGLEGAASELLVPCYSRYRPVDYNGRMVTASAGTGLHLTDHGGFGHEEERIMWTAAPAVLRSTRLTISHPNVPALRPGHWFGIGHRLYQVSKQWQTALEDVQLVGGTITYDGQDIEYDDVDITYGQPTVTRLGSAVSEIEFWPPLRETVSGGTSLILGRPVCKMRLASDETGIIDQVARSSTPTLEFAEVI